jgi:hypothetical protein
MPAMPILHLVIRNQPANGDHVVFVQGRESEALDVQFVPGADFKRDLDALHDRGPARFLRFEDQEPVCAHLGETLFRAFVQARALDRYREYRQGADRPRIALHLPRSLYYLPWELLRDPADPPGQFLSVQGSVVRFDAEAAGPTTHSFGQPNASSPSCSCCQRR